MANIRGFQTSRFFNGSQEYAPSFRETCYLRELENYRTVWVSRTNPTSCHPVVPADRSWGVWVLEKGEFKATPPRKSGFKTHAAAEEWAIAHIVNRIK